MSASTPTSDDSLKVVHSRRYLGLLVFAAILGVPISAAAYWFLWALNHGRHWFFETLPAGLGFTTAPASAASNRRRIAYRHGGGLPARARRPFAGGRVPGGRSARFCSAHRSWARFSCWKPERSSRGR